MHMQHIGGCESSEICTWPDDLTSIEPVWSPRRIASYTSCFYATAIRIISRWNMTYLLSNYGKFVIYLGQKREGSIVLDDYLILRNRGLLRCTRGPDSGERIMLVLLRELKYSVRGRAVSKQDEHASIPSIHEKLWLPLSDHWLSVMGEWKDQNWSRDLRLLSYKIPAKFSESRHGIFSIAAG